MCWRGIIVAFVLRFVSYAFMTALALWNELRPGPTVPDRLIQLVPYVESVARYNYVAWLYLYTPLSFVLLYIDPRRWIRYMHAGAMVSVLRGLCIVLTALGTPDPAHNPSGILQRGWWEIYLDLISPLGVFKRNALHAYLTRDLFFSGHTATTFLLMLYAWRHARLRVLGVIVHVAVLVTVITSHIHYAIDIVGAWAITFCVYALREWQPRERD